MATNSICDMTIIVSFCCAYSNYTLKPIRETRNFIGTVESKIDLLEAKPNINYP